MSDVSTEKTNDRYSPKWLWMLREQLALHARDLTPVRLLLWAGMMAAPKPVAINASRQWICAAGVCESLSSHGKAIGVCPTEQARLEVIHEW